MIGDRRAVAAVEFAIAAPVLIFMAFATAETVSYIRTRNLFLAATASLADLIASQPGATPGSTGTLADACKGVLYTLTSYSGGNLAASIASVSNLNGAGAARDWENDAACPTAGPAIGAGGAVSLAGALVPNTGDSVIAIQSSFTYTPPFSPIVIPAFTFHQTVFARPRFGQVVCLTC